jgi:diguanylate cyclase (GGDEF)-like protein
LVENEFKSTIKSTFDELTGLTNRCGFSGIAKHVLTMCARTSIPATLLYFNIDNIKLINKQLGTEQGDKALLKFAQTLLNGFRSSDIFARLGGNEFSVLLTGTDKESIMTPTNRLYATLEAFNNSKSAPFQLEISYGLVHFDRNQHKNITDLLIEADTLMYVHKKMRRPD